MSGGGKLEGNPERASQQPPDFLDGQRAGGHCLVMLCLGQMIGNNHWAPSIKFPPPGAEGDSLAMDRENLMKRIQDLVGLGMEKLKIKR